MDEKISLLDAKMSDPGFWINIPDQQYWYRICGS
jgi:hypothetical protein